MMRTDITECLGRLRFLAVLVCFICFICSCSDDLLGDISGSVEEEVADGVYILTRVSDNSEGTRASISSTASWEGGSFDEVGISSLSVLFFKPDSTTSADGSVSVSYTLARALTTTVTSPSTTARDTVTNSAGEKAIRWMIPSPPTTSSVENYTQSSKTSITPTGSNTAATPASVSEVPAWYKMYVIANHSWGDDDLTIGTTTPSDLQKLLTNEDSSDKFSPSGSRDYGSFQMSDTLTGLNSMVDYTDGYGVTTRRDFEVSLQRALAKMCMRVYYAPTGSENYTQLLHTGSATDTGEDRFYNTEHSFAFRLMQYAACTPLTLDGTGAATVYSRTGTGAKSDTIHTLYEQSSENLVVPSTDQHTLYSIETTTTDDDGNETTTREDACVVYYLYPNNWADSTAIETGSLNTGAPIIEERQTYLEMQIKYTPSSTRTVTYTYEIPTNYLLPEYNDAVSLTDAQKEELYSAYRIDRNTAYWTNLYVSEVEAGLRVALSTGSGSSAAIADLEDDPNVVNLEATSTTLTISDFGDGTGDGQSYSLSAGDSIAAFTLGSTTTVDANGDTITVTNSEGIDSDGNYYQQITTTARHDASSSATTTTLSGTTVTYGTATTASTSSRRRSASDKTIYFTSATQSEQADSTLITTATTTRTYASDLSSYTLTNSTSQSLARKLWTSVSTDSVASNYSITNSGTTYTGTKFKEIDYTRYRYYTGFGDLTSLTALVDGIYSYTTTDSINATNSTRNDSAASITISDTAYAVPSATTSSLTAKASTTQAATDTTSTGLLTTITEDIALTPTTTTTTTYPDTTLTFYETVDLSSITSVTSNITSYSVSGSTCTCGGTLTIKYTSDSSWTATSSTSYTATTTSSDTNTGEGGESNGGGTTGGSTFSGGGGSSARRAGEGTIDDSTDGGNTEGGTTGEGTTSNTATISRITCTTTYTGTGQSTYTGTGQSTYTLSATIQVTYTLSGTGGQTSTATYTYTSTDLKTWTESTSSARRRRKR